mgnify:CR=1 FL=1
MEKKKHFDKRYSIRKSPLIEHLQKSEKATSYSYEYCAFLLFFLRNSNCRMNNKYSLFLFFKIGDRR